MQNRAQQLQTALSGRDVAVYNLSNILAQWLHLRYIHHGIVKASDPIRDLKKNYLVYTQRFKHLNLL